MKGQDNQGAVTDIDMSDADKTAFANNMKGAFGNDTPPADNQQQAQTQTQQTNTAPDYTPLLKELGFEKVDDLKAKLSATNEGQPDYAKYLKENLGVESVDQAKLAFEKANQLETILPEYNTLKNQTLTPFAKIANELEQKGVKPATIARFHGLDLKNMPDAEVLALSEEVKTPQLNKGQVDAILEEKYGVSDDLLTDNQKLVREANRTKDAAIARGELEKYIADIFNPSEQKVNPEILEREKTRGTFWQSNINKIDEGNFKIERPLKVSVADRQGKKDLEMNFSYDVKPETKATIVNDLKTMIQLNPELFTADGKGMDNANAYVRNRMFALEGPNIIQQFIEHTKSVESKINEHYATLLHNPVQRNQPANFTANQSGKEAFNKNAEAGLNKVTGG